MAYAGEMPVLVRRAVIDLTLIMLAPVALLLLGAVVIALQQRGARAGAVPFPGYDDADLDAVDLPPNQASWEQADGEYHWRPGSRRDASVHWDPFVPQNTRRERIRAARQRRRRSAGYYALLGVDSAASDREIERAYRRRVAEWHPDRFHNDPIAHRDAERRLRELNKAIVILRDPLKRAKYDASL